MALYANNANSDVDEGSDQSLYGGEGHEESSEEADPDYSEGSEATTALIQTLRRHKVLFGGMDGEDEEDEASFEVEDEDEDADNASEDTEDETDEDAEDESEDAEGDAEEEDADDEDAEDESEDAEG